MSEPIVDYCREIEDYLCRKNDGHLIRVVGPSFEIVSGWAAQGVPLKVAYSGIDRCFERYYRKGPRRRPIKIDFCEADVLDAFDEWRRALGLVAAGTAGTAVATEERPAAPASSSLPAHLERVITRLTAARAMGKIDAAFDALIDRISGELDTARVSARGVRGEAREALLARLKRLDDELMHTARARLDDESHTALLGEADAELATYRDRMAPDAFARARDTAVDRLVRERFGLPIVTV
ncbi:MAG: hypothetical protein ABJA98_01025 [Acidobacteriota bacterium]